jgi:hypothetical protein
VRCKGPASEFNIVGLPIGFDLASGGFNNQKNENRQSHSHRKPENAEGDQLGLLCAFL